LPRRLTFVEMSRFDRATMSASISSRLGCWHTRHGPSLASDPPWNRSRTLTRNHWNLRPSSAEPEPTTTGFGRHPKSGSSQTRFRSLGDGSIVVTRVQIGPLNPDAPTWPKPAVGPLRATPILTGHLLRPRREGHPPKLGRLKSRCRSVPMSRPAGHPFVLRIIIQRWRVGQRWRVRGVYRPAFRNESACEPRHNQPRSGCLQFRLQSIWVQLQ
jgi:hypothetical protein